MDRKAISERAQELADPIIQNNGLELVDCEFTNEFGIWILRFYIDKEPNGVTVEDCQNISRAISGVLDVEDVVPVRYSLEVSSPGLERPLKKARDFEKYAGSQARLRTLHPVNDNRSNYFGTIFGMNGENVVMKVDGVEYKIPINELARAKLVYQDAKKSKRKAK